MRGDRDNGTVGSTFAEKRNRIRHLMRKEFLQLVRNKQNFRILLIAPLFQLMIFGYAVRLDVKDVATVVADLSRSQMSRELIDAFSQSGYFRMEAFLDSYAEADRFLEDGSAKVALLIPPDMEQRIKGYRTAQVGILIDGVDTTTAGTVSGYAESIIQGFSADLLQTRIQWARSLRHSLGRQDLILPSVSARPRAWFNPNLDSRNFFVPGVLALILTFFSMVLTSMALVREKERGTIEQLMVTPLTRLELIVGKIAPCFLVSCLNLVVMTFLAVSWFDPFMRGSLLFFFFAAILFLMTCLALGMTISVFCQTQQQAMLSSFMVLQPAVLLSGFVFPIENMPGVIQYVTYINPLRYFIVIVREVFLKGAGPDILWPQLIPIALMGIFYIALSSFLFKKKID